MVTFRVDSICLPDLHAESEGTMILRVQVVIEHKYNCMYIYTRSHLFIVGPICFQTEIFSRSLIDIMRRSMFDLLNANHVTCIIVLNVVDPLC